jgi:hypothetical protein
MEHSFISREVKRVMINVVKAQDVKSGARKCRPFPPQVTGRQRALHIKDLGGSGSVSKAVLNFNDHTDGSAC